MKFSLIASIFLASQISALKFTGKFVGVPEDAIEAQTGKLKSPIVNGLNFQSRIDVKFKEIVENQNPHSLDVAVNKNYEFQVLDLTEGEYQLQISSYDFNLRSDRYRVIVNDQISVFEDSLGLENYNISSFQTVGPNTPLVVEITSYKEYYLSPEGKLGEMLMNSPLGFIFKNSLYTALFIAALSIMAMPTLISYIAPDLAEQMNEMQKEALGQSAPIENVPQAAKPSVKRK